MLHVYERKVKPVIKTVAEALDNPLGRCYIQTFEKNLVLPFDNRALDNIFIGQFNKGNSIFRLGTPYPCLVVEKDEAPYSFERIIRDETYPVKEWPSYIDDPSLYYRDKKGHTQKALDTFGHGAKTFLGEQDIENWILYWSVVDMIEGTGSMVCKLDNRIPSRDRFLKPYRLESYHDSRFDGMNNEEALKELNFTMQRHFAPIASVRKRIEEWFSEEPGSCFNVHFDGPTLKVDRLIDTRIIAYMADHEQHSMLERLNVNGLI